MKKREIALLVALLWFYQPFCIGKNTDTNLVKIPFPDIVGTFIKIDTHYFENPAFGYVVTFKTLDASEVLDVYIFPVDAKFAQLENKQLVDIFLLEAQQGINDAVKLGIYTKADKHGVIAYPFDNYYILKSQYTIQTAHGELYSVIYITEYNGTVIKLRISIPNKSKNDVLDEIETTAFELIQVALDALQSS